MDALEECVGRLRSEQLASMSFGELAVVLQRVESARVRLEQFSNATLAVLDTARTTSPSAEAQPDDSPAITAARAASSTPVAIMQLLRLDPAPARARLRLAEQFGPRRALTGEALPPAYPLVAEALSAGRISSAHAELIVRSIKSLPLTLALLHASHIEADLVALSQELTVREVSMCAARMLHALDSDGSEPREIAQQARGVTLYTRPDRSGELRGRLTPEAVAVWEAVLDSLAQPTTSPEGAYDDRTAAQRRHDALLDAGHRLLRDGGLPNTGGAPVSIIVTVTADDLRDGIGRTGHGTVLRLPEILRIGDEAEVTTVLTNNDGRILSVGRDSRCATYSQRRALVGRDLGCTFPGCVVPATWTQVHHVLEWSKGGETSLENMALVCGHHHRNFEQLGWAVVMTDGVPWWIPPKWADPEQRPRQNVVHHDQHRAELIRDVMRRYEEVDDC